MVKTRKGRGIGPVRVVRGQKVVFYDRKANLLGESGTKHSAEIIEKATSRFGCTVDHGPLLGRSGQSWT